MIKIQSLYVLFLTNCRDFIYEKEVNICKVFEYAVISQQIKIFYCSKKKVY